MNVDLANVQGLVTTLYRAKVSRHLLWNFSSQAGAKAFLSELLPFITNAQIKPDVKPEPMVNLGLTCGGLQTLGVAPSILSEFDVMYTRGPDPNLLGDAYGSASDEPNWWEGQFATRDLHATLHLYCQQDSTLEATTQQLRQIAERHGVKELIPRHNGEIIEGRSLGGRRLHFSYMDGFSQPDVVWGDVPDTDAANSVTPSGSVTSGSTPNGDLPSGSTSTGSVSSGSNWNTPQSLDFRNFLLGYGTDQIQSFPLKGEAAALVKDSSYAVFRWLYQDVAAFNQFLANNAVHFPHLAPEDAQELLAAKMMGRWRDGTPLVLSPDKPDATVRDDNNFEYATEDSQGFRCPFSAHVRVVNPRDEPLVATVMGGVPRVLRRGTPYGPELVGNVDDGQDRGLVGIFICTNIMRQIYTLTSWIKQNTFSPVFNTNSRVQDPLMGNRKVAGTVSDFIIPGPEGDLKIQGLPDFIRTKGTAFLLLPSVTTITALSKPNA